MAPTFVLLFANTNENTKIDANPQDPSRLPRFPAETHSIYSGRYTLLKSHIACSNGPTNSVRRWQHHQFVLDFLHFNMLRCTIFFQFQFRHMSIFLLPTCRWERVNLFVVYSLSAQIFYLRHRWLIDTVVVHYNEIHARVVKDVEKERIKAKREIEEIKVNHNIYYFTSILRMCDQHHRFEPFVSHISEYKFISNQNSRYVYRPSTMRFLN